MSNYNGEPNFLLRLREPPLFDHATSALGDPCKMSSFQQTLDTVMEALNSDDESYDDSGNVNVGGYSNGFATFNDSNNNSSSFGHRYAKCLRLYYYIIMSEIVL